MKKTLRNNIESNLSFNFSIRLLRLFVDTNRNFDAKTNSERLYISTDSFSFASEKKNSSYEVHIALNAVFVN